MILLALTGGMLLEGLTRPNEWLYRRARRGSQRVRHLVQRQWLWISVSILFVLAISRDQGASRLFIVTLLVALVPVLWWVHHSLVPWFRRKLLKRSPHWKLTTDVVASPVEMRSLREEILTSSDFLNSGREMPINRDTQLKNIESWCSESKADVILLGTNIPSHFARYLFELGDRKGIRIWMRLNCNGLEDRALGLDKVGNTQVLVPKISPLSNLTNQMIKRAVDVGVSSLIIFIVLPPLMLLVKLLHLRYSPGPLFFRQRRVGRNHKPFDVLKFRTMHVHNDDECRQATKSDERIFRGGGLLRKLSLDEFPQFINVLQGHMSVVGPRPHLEQHERVFENSYRKYGLRRLSKPGVTGLAQVRGYRGEIRNPTDIRGRARYDLIYSQRWSLSLDFWIIFRTALQVVAPHRNAH
ncbi:MAG: sugar transferase [Verrucomicrobiota bacterium]